MPDAIIKGVRNAYKKWHIFQKWSPFCYVLTPEGELQNGSLCLKSSVHKSISFLFQPTKKQACVFSTNPQVDILLLKIGDIFTELTKKLSSYIQIEQCSVKKCAFFFLSLRENKFSNLLLNFSSNCKSFSSKRRLKIIWSNFTKNLSNEKLREINVFCYIANWFHEIFLMLHSYTYCGNYGVLLPRFFAKIPSN